MALFSHDERFGMRWHWITGCCCLTEWLYCLILTLAKALSPCDSAKWWAYWDKEYLQNKRFEDWQQIMSCWCAGVQPDCVDKDTGHFVSFNHSELLLFSSALPSVRKLWVSSSFPAMNDLLVQWESPTAPPSVPSVSHFAVEWCPKPRPSSCRLTTVDSVLTSIVIQGVTNNTPFVYLFNLFVHLEKYPTTPENKCVLNLGYACF